MYTCVFVVDDRNNRILLGFKKRGLLKNKWNGFGGKVEPGETVFEAALRLVCVVSLIFIPDENKK